MTVASKAEKLYGFTWLGASGRDYLGWLKRSGALDQEHYRRTHSRLAWVFRRFPERHYVAFGESLGLSPRPDFAPWSYRRLNEDLPAEANTRPLQHFIEAGQAEGRIAVEPLAGATYNPPGVIGGPQQRVAIVLHLYFLDLWPEFGDHLEQLPFDFDLFVTLTEWANKADPVNDAIKQRFPTSSVTVLPNHGRDMYPFMHLLNAGALDGYDMVCKVHGKRSVHRRDGATWRQSMVNDLLPGPSSAKLLEGFAADTEAHVLAGQGRLRHDDDAWGDNRRRIDEMLLRGGEPASSGLAPFPAGSMFWAKAPVLKWLQALGIDRSDFEPELGQLDGTAAHAIERLIGFGAQRTNGKCIETTDIVARP